MVVFCSEKTNIASTVPIEPSEKSLFKLHLMYKNFGKTFYGNPIDLNTNNGLPNTLEQQLTVSRYVLTAYLFFITFFDKFITFDEVAQILSLLPQEKKVIKN